MSEIKLLPCPFCGGEAKACKYYFIQCTKCGTSTLTHTNREEAIESWNTRKPMQEIVEKLESKKKNICGSYNYATQTLETPSHKVAFNNGISEAIETVKGVMHERT